MLVQNYVSENKKGGNVKKIKLVNPQSRTDKSTKVKIVDPDAPLINIKGIYSLYTLFSAICSTKNPFCGLISIPIHPISPRNTPNSIQTNH
jgi:hypothetical protein